MDTLFMLFFFCILLRPSVALEAHWKLFMCDAWPRAVCCAFFSRLVKSNVIFIMVFNDTTRLDGRS